MHYQTKLCSLFIILLGFFNSLHSQNIKNSSLTIKDHNGITSPVTIDCDYNFNENHCVTLNIEYPEIKNPTDYSLSSIPFSPVGNFSEGNEIKIDKDDKWSSAIKLPFDFCFYGNTFNSIIVGDNGVISFDTEYAGTECPYTIAGSIPNQALISNAIFGAYHDMTNDNDVFGCTQDCGRISLYTTGTAPYRKAVINYYRMNHFGCEEIKSTLQIVLYETTNVIDIYIKDKPLTCVIGNEKRALVGITNSDSSMGISPEGRNTGIWETHNEAWRFTPSGASTTTVKWFDSSHKEIGSGSSVEICPQKSSSYSAEVTYNVCKPITLSNDFQIEYSQQYPSAQNIVKNYCFTDDTTGKTVNFTSLIPESIGNQTGIKTSLHASINDAISGENPMEGLDSYFMQNLSQTFYLRVEKSKDCFAVSSLTINLNKTPVLSGNDHFYVCRNKNSNQELVYLHNYDSQVKGYEKWMKIEYYASSNDANAGVNSINTISLSNTMTVYARAVNSESKDCFSVSAISFTLLQTINSKPQSVVLCNENADGKEIYDLTLYEKTLSNSQEYSFSYYKTEKEATSEINPISDPKNYTINNGTVIYVKIKKEGFCDSIETIKFNFTSTAINNLTEIICGKDNKELLVNINEYYNKMIGTTPVSLLGFYSTLSGAINNDSSQLITDPEHFKVIPPYSTVYVKFRDNSINCNFIREIKIEVIEQIGKQPSYPVCDLNNDGQENFKLNTLNSIFLAGYPPSEITYYATLEDYNSGKNPINEIIVKGTTRVYIKLQVINACHFLYYIDLELVSFNLSEAKTVTLCDSQNDGKEVYNLNSLISEFGITNYSSVKYYFTKEDAFTEVNPIKNSTSYLIPNNKHTIFIRVNYEKGCPLIIPVQFILSESVNIPDLSLIEVCDPDNDNSENIDLSKIFKQNSINIQGIDYGFYISQKGAESKNINELIKNYPSYTITQKNTKIYVRFENSTTGCFVVKPLTIKLNPLPEIIKTTLSVCDFGNDGSEMINLSSLNSQLVKNTQGFAFTYFLNEKDAINSENEIKTYQVNSSSHIYVKIYSGSECFIIQKIAFQFVTPPVTYNKIIEICDNNADDKEVVNLTLYEKELTGNSGNKFSFSYFTTFEQAYNNTQAINSVTNYFLQSFPTTIFVRVKDNSGCFSIAELTFKSANKIEANKYIANLCDENSDMQEYVDLTSYISQMLISSPQNLVISYYKTEKGAEIKNNQELINNPKNYSATLAQDYAWVRFDNPATGCYTIRSIEINLIALPKLINNKYLVCDDNLDDIFSLDLDELQYSVIHNPEGFTFTYYHSIEDATYNKNKIETPHYYIIHSFNEDIIVKATNTYGCSSIKKVTLYTQEKIPVNQQEIEIYSCDDDFDGITTFDLTTATHSLTNSENAEFEFYSNLKDAQNQKNPIINYTSYHNSSPKKDYVYVRVTSPDYCPSLGIIKLNVLPVPISTLRQEEKICPNGTLELDAGSNNEIISYLWNTGEKSQKITINKAGKYSVTLTGKNGCTYTYTVNVTEYEEIIITDFKEGENYITVIAKGPSPLEYSMDNIHWQDNNTFNNLEPGVYTFYVRSKANNCISPSKKAVIFKVNNVITPNGDGKNDTWELCGLENFDSNPSHIKIFDRQGKVVFENSSNTCFVWDGYYLGRPLATTSYWYVIDIIDGRKFTGWILLRNYDENFR